LLIIIGESFFPRETKKTAFFAEIFKIQGNFGPLLPTPMSALLNASDRYQEQAFGILAWDSYGTNSLFNVSWPIAININLF